MISIGMDAHQSSTTFFLFDPAKEKAGRYRTVARVHDTFGGIELSQAET